ncbi:MAG TPA: M20/M25/M40 family metallo-hydrolase [Gemmatimonadales bacterium]|nr:M20/M25/M40 family metallo-hydrolase [Gemmatimonadales bacterium]
MSLARVVRSATGCVLLAACGGSAPASSSGAESLVATDEVREIVGVLAADSLEGRRTGTPGSARASRFLAERMRRYGLEPAGDSGYFQRVTYQVAQGPEGETLRLASPDSADTAHTVVDYNLVGLIRGSDRSLRSEAIVLGAHFDHIGIGTPVEGDSINNGADDDASGVATVLAASRALAKDPPKRTILVLLTSGEEYGVLGTQWYLERPKFPLDSTVADLQVEMVGRPDTLVGAGKLWLTGFERSTMGEELSAAGIPVVADPRPEFRFFERSDNIVFALRGIPAHTLSSYGLHKDYHQPSDEVERIDFDHLARAADLVARAARVLADGPRPSWKPGGRPGPSTP